MPPEEPEQILGAGRPERRERLGQLADAREALRRLLFEAPHDDLLERPIDRRVALGERSRRLVDDDGGHLREPVAREIERRMAGDHLVENDAE